MDISKILENTPFKHPNNIYKDNTIPILKDYNISDQCKEIGKQLLNSTKNPTCQHVDVLIPNSDRANFHKMEHFKSFFGKKFDEPKIETKQSQPEKHNKVNNIKKAKGPNACLVETPITKPINEFITVTENYVEQLEAVVTKVMRPIRESIIDPSKQPILDQYSFNRIYINMEDILQVNQAFLVSLKQYQHGTTSDSFGTILSRHVEALDCYKIFLLGKANSQTCHQQSLSKNKNYTKFLLTITLPKNYGVNDVLSNPVQQMARYDLMISNILKHMDIHDSDVDLLKQVITKVACISDMRYGSDSSLLNLYHLIREAPASLIKSRKLLGYYDASELSISTGKTHRPITLLIFTDKIMVVKRKNYSLQSKDFLEKIEEKIKIGSSSNLIQKAKEVYNGLPFEFKGWVDIQSTEFFHGLKDRPDTFFLRTCLQELNPNATEKETETYFRKSDRLYSIIPNTLNKNLSTFIAKKQELMNLCQKQLALLKVESSELYHQDKFKLSTWTHIYNETSYKQQQNKNNILIVYVEQTMPKLEFLNNDENVWVVMLLTHHEGGYKLTIRSRTNLIPIRELSREIEYESIIPHGEHSTGMKKDANSPLDFIDTLWNNVFFYERRLRATEAYSGINDDLLRDRARSRSRSKSLTRVASNMSIGKLFARSRDNSPSRHRSSSISSSNNDRTTDDDDFDYDEAEKPASHVPDPIFKVATISKHTGSEFRDKDATTAAYNAPTTKRPIRTQPRYVAPNEIFVRDDHAFIIDPFPPKDNLQDRYQHREYSNSFDAMLFSSSSNSSSPEPLSSSRSSSRNGSGSSSLSDTDRLLLSRGMPGDAATTYSGSSTSNSIRSYFDENHFFPGSVRNNTFDENHFFSPSSSTSRLQQRNRSYDERLMNTIDNSVRRTSSATRTRTPLHPNLYNTTTPPPNQQPPQLQHRTHTMPDMMSHNFNQLKNDVNGLIDELIHSQQQLRSQQDMNRYYNNTYEHVQGLRTHIVSRLDNLMENLHQSTHQLR